MRDPSETLLDRDPLAEGPVRIVIDRDPLAAEPVCIVLGRDPLVESPSVPLSNAIVAQTNGSVVHSRVFVPHIVGAKSAIWVAVGRTGRAESSLLAMASVGDQPTWAKIAKARGASAGSVHRKKLRGRWPREQSDRMLADEDLQRSARELGEAIGKENGVVSAVELIGGIGGRSSPWTTCPRRTRVLS